MSDSTRIRRDNERDTTALAGLYADEDTDRGFLARQLVRNEEEYQVQREYADECYRKALAAEAERDEALARLSSIGGYEGYDDALERLRKQRNQLLIGSLETTVALLDAEVIFAHDFAPALRQKLVRALATEGTTT